jgi:hypothetical protein
MSLRATANLLDRLQRDQIDEIEEKSPKMCPNPFFVITNK